MVMLLINMHISLLVPPPSYCSGALARELNITLYRFIAVNEPSLEAIAQLEV